MMRLLLFILFLMLSLFQCGDVLDGDDVALAPTEPTPTLPPTATTTPEAEATLPPLFAPEEAFSTFDFEGITLDGEVITLTNRPTAWTVLNFWATWCVPCVEEMPALQAVADQYPEVTVLGLNVNDTPEDIIAFAEDNDITFPLLYNVTDQTVFDYNVLALPQTIIIAPNGDMVWRQFGPIEIESFSADLEVLFERYAD